MIAVSDSFKNAMKQPIKQLQAYIRTNDINITDADDLISFKISCSTSMCKTAMRKLEAKYLGECNLLGKWVHVGYAVKLPNGTYDYLDYGSFLVSEITYSKDTESTNIVGYDKMVSSMKEYSVLDITYPINLYNYTKAICQACDLELGNESLPTMNSFIISKELWENISGITYRDILVQIAQATASTCIISNNDKVYFKPNTPTGEILTYDNMFKLKLEEKYGEINSVVLSRTPAEDNIYRRDEASIELNGLTEFKIENNEIIDKDRDVAMQFLYPALHGISYYPFEAQTEGLGWYEIGDSITIVNDSGIEFDTTIFNISISLDGSFKETLKTVADTKTQTQYQYASTIAKRIKNTEIIVDKQEQTITNLVTDMYDENGMINHNFTEVHQDINNIINNVQHSGGNNLIRNSVMFAYDDDNNPNEWTISGTGSLNINSNTESLTVGAISGHSFELLNKYASQTVRVKKDDDTITEKNKTYYTFTTRIKKATTGNCYVRVFNSVEEYRIEIPSGTSAYYQEYTLTLLPKDTYYTFEFYGSANSEATFTDNMLSLGKYKTQWTQANGEIMNTQVNINVDGVLVKSSVYLGDYTVMSPLEFAGYSKINGTTTRVFSLNKDTTLVKKLNAEDELKMVPIKVVPITSGDLQGWAFVPST